MNVTDDKLKTYLDQIQDTPKRDRERIALAHSFYKLLNQKYNLNFIEIDQYISQLSTEALPDLGKIKQARKTYNVVGNINENQVSIGETTFTGRTELKDSTGIMDYGSLMYIALQRATTARHAIKIMTDLVAEYGYYSTGESFSISDPNEVWLMEMIGKGPGNTGQ